MKKLIIFGIIVFLILIMSSSCFVFFGDEEEEEEEEVFYGTLRIRNTSSTWEIWYVRVREVGDTLFSTDLLAATEVIATNSSRSFTLPTGDYDVQVEDNDEFVYTATNVSIFDGSATTLVYDGYGLD